MPSYLSSTQTVGPRRPMISAASSAGDASMNLSGWNRVIAASARRSSRARTAVRPMSPVSIPARLTASSGRPNAFAMAASSRPSRRPMRSSPLRTFTMPPAVRGDERASSASRIAALAAAPDAPAAASNVARTSVTVGSAAGSGAWPAPSSTSTTAVATSDERS